MYILYVLQNLENKRCIHMQLSTNLFLVICDGASCSTRRGVRESVSPTHWLVHIVLEVTVAGEGAGRIDRAQRVRNDKPKVKNTICLFYGTKAISSIKKKVN